MEVTAKDGASRASVSDGGMAAHTRHQNFDSKFSDVFAGLNYFGTSCQASNIIHDLYSYDSHTCVFFLYVRAFRFSTNKAEYQFVVDNGARRFHCLSHLGISPDFLLAVGRAVYWKNSSNPGTFGTEPLNWTVHPCLCHVLSPFAKFWPILLGCQFTSL